MQLLSTSVLYASDWMKHSFRLGHITQLSQKYLQPSSVFLTLICAGSVSGRSRYLSGLCSLTYVGLKQLAGKTAQ